MASDCHRLGVLRVPLEQLVLVEGDRVVVPLRVQVHGDEVLERLRVLRIGLRILLEVVDGLLGELEVLRVLGPGLVHAHVRDPDVLVELRLLGVEAQRLLVLGERRLVLRRLQELVAPFRRLLGLDFVAAGQRRNRQDEKDGRSRTLPMAWHASLSLLTLFALTLNPPGP